MNVFTGERSMDDLQAYLAQLNNQLSRAVQRILAGLIRSSLGVRIRWSCR